MDQATEFHPPPLKSNWPSTFGIIGIIVGILGFLSAASQIANIAFMKAMGDSLVVIPESGTGNTDADAAIEDAVSGMMTDIEAFAQTKIISDIALLILSVVLFVGGILLLQRYRKSRAILLGWSYAKIIVGLYSVYQVRKMISIMGGSMGAMFNEQMASIPGGAASAPPFDMVKLYDIMGLVWLVIGGIWVLALPILFLIWFNRQDIIDDIAGGYGWK
ncbi:MAG: hypothetical protein P1U89_09000 [Verrucomicrobiales bacterium]|nr:hypothetical protein [Verrucomicrobiales bacterium]